MVGYQANTQLEMRWSQVIDVKGRTRMQARWLVPGQADTRADTRADTVTLEVDAA